MTSVRMLWAMAVKGVVGVVLLAMMKDEIDTCRISFIVAASCVVCDDVGHRVH